MKASILKFALVVFVAHGVFAQVPTVPRVPTVPGAPAVPGVPAIPTRIPEGRLPPSMRKLPPGWVRGLLIDNATYPLRNQDARCPIQSNGVALGTYTLSAGVTIACHFPDDRCFGSFFGESIMAVSLPAAMVNVLPVEARPGIPGGNYATLKVPLTVLLTLRGGPVGYANLNELAQFQVTESKDDKVFVILPLPREHLLVPKFNVQLESDPRKPATLPPAITAPVATFTQKLRIARIGLSNDPQIAAVVEALKKAGYEVNMPELSDATIAKYDVFFVESFHALIAQCSEQQREAFKKLLKTRGKLLLIGLNGDEYPISQIRGHGADQKLLNDHYKRFEMTQVDYSKNSAAKVEPNHDATGCDILAWCFQMGATHAKQKSAEVIQAAADAKIATFNQTKLYPALLSALQSTHPTHQ